MSAISGISSSSAMYPAQQCAPRHSVQDPISRVAGLLNLTDSDLAGQLAGGKTLYDIADKQGVSRDAVLATIKSSLPSGTGNADRIADRIANSDGAAPESSSPCHSRGALPDRNRLEKLDIDPDKVTSASGVVTLLQQRGLDLGQFKSVMQSGDLLDVSA